MECSLQVEQGKVLRDRNIIYQPSWTMKSMMRILVDVIKLPYRVSRLWEQKDPGVGHPLNVGSSIIRVDEPALRYKSVDN